MNGTSLPKWLTFAKLYKALMVFLWIYCVFMFPFRSSFLYHPTSSLLILLFVIVDVLLTILLLYYIFGIQLRKPYENEYGQKVDDIKLIFQRYLLQGYFIVDLLVALPLDIVPNILIWLGMLDGTDFAVRLFLLFLRLPKLFAVIRLVKFSFYLSKKISIYVDTMYFRFLQLLFTIFLACHLIGCSYWFICSYIGFGQDEWVADSKWENEAILSQYLHALFWSLSKMCGGELQTFSDPTNNLETVFQMVVLFAGITTYATIIGNIGSLIMRFNQKESERVEKLENINRSLRLRRVPQELQFRVREFYKYKLQNSELNDGLEILEDLPGQLRADVCLHLYKELLLKVSFFKDATEYLLQELVLHLHPRVVAPGEYIFKFGAVGREMFFINKGKLDIIADTGIHLATLDEGKIFGEFALLTNERRSASAKTKTFCELFVLSKEAFDDVCKDFPEFVKKLEVVKVERMQQNLEKQKANINRFIHKSRKGSLGSVSSVGSDMEAAGTPQSPTLEGQLPTQRAIQIFNIDEVEEEEHGQHHPLLPPHVSELIPTPPSSLPRKRSFKELQHQQQHQELILRQVTEEEDK